MSRILVHGWGFDAGFWDPLRTALGDGAAVVDLGFRGAPAMPDLPPEGSRLAIGHSLGGLWLLTEAPWTWDGLVLINGFPRFTETADFAPAVAPRLVRRMRRRLADDPPGVVAEFLALCGSDERPLELDPAALDRGLAWLETGDGRDRLGGPVLVLAAGDDPVVPPAMTEAAFAGRPQVTVDWRAEGGHLLPVTAPDWCAARIRAFEAAL